MTANPYLLFAEVSLDLSRKEFHSALTKLEPSSAMLADSYLFNILYGKALRGLSRYRQAGEHFRICCAIAPANQVAWKELAALQSIISEELPDISAEPFDPVMEELEQLSAALMNFQPVKISENSNPTPILEQKQPFSDDTTIAVPTETLATLFTSQGAYKKAIKIYTHLIQLKPAQAEHYQSQIDSLLDQL